MLHSHSHHQPPNKQHVGVLQVLHTHLHNEARNLKSSRLNRHFIYPVGSVSLEHMFFFMFIVTVYLLITPLCLYYSFYLVTVSDDFIRDICVIPDNTIGLSS